MKLKVILDGDAAVACVNDDVCLSTRMYDRRENTFGIWSDTVGSEFNEVCVLKPSAETTRPCPAPKKVTHHPTDSGSKFPMRTM